ncbi:MAG TPA: LysR family transcriptional regulator [Dongiaceae bacterium]|nr:LysR family transcriptional regulator [Dongiaceae bacterium]
MHIGKVDLNLYLVLDAIFREGTITRAAVGLNLTQPAVSHALARLRDVYGDPLFTRAGNRMVPTALARSIIQPVRDALSGLQHTLSAPASFDPTTNRKQIVLGMRDFVETVLVAELAPLLEQLAPLTQMASVRVARRDMEAELTSGRLDLAFDVLLPVGPAIAHTRLMEGRFVVVSCKRHPLLRGGLTLEKYLQSRHVVVSSRRSGPTVEDFELSRLGLHRDIGMRCQNFFVAWKTIAQSRMLLTVPESHTRHDLLRHNLKVWPMPVELPPFTVHMYWNENLNDDPANRWLREQVLELVRRAAL